MAAPDPADYRTASEYRWRRKMWRRQHGGSLIGNTLFAFLVGAVITRSAALTVVFAVVAIVVTLGRRATS